METEELLVGRLIAHLEVLNITCLELGSATPLALKLFKSCDPVRRVHFVNIASSAVTDRAIENSRSLQNFCKIFMTR